MTVLPFDTILRDFEVDGVPSSGQHKPIKRDFRDTLNAEIEAAKNPTFTQDGTGAVARPLIAKIKDGPVSLEDFGYVSGDALAPMNNAIACGQPIQLGPKLYALSAQPASPTNRTLVMKGVKGATILRFLAATAGLNVAQDDYTHATQIEDIIFETTSAEPGAGLHVAYSAADSFNNRNQDRMILRNIIARGNNMFSAGWQYGIHLHNVHNGIVENPLSVGRRNNSLAQTVKGHWCNMASGIHLTSDGGFTAVPSDLHILNPRAYHATYGVDASGEYEGIRIMNPILVAVDEGVHVVEDSVRPWIQVQSGHINCFKYGVNLVNADQSNIQDLLIYKFQNAAETTTAVRLAGCNHSQVSGLRLYNLCTNATVSGEWDGVLLENTNDCTVGKIVHHQPSRTVQLTGSSTGNAIETPLQSGVYSNAAEIAAVKDTSSGVNVYGGQAAGTKSASALAPTSTGVVLATTAISNGVKRGERYQITATANMLKGATAGMDILQVSKSSGTSTVAFSLDKSNLSSRAYSPATETVDLICSGVMTILASGSLTLSSTGFSFGSNSSVAAGDAQITITKL